MTTDRLRQLLERIDQLNREDPTTELVEGTPQPRELVYAQRLSAWVKRLDPNSSEALQIAARAQHLQRWTIPRDRYEKNRQGYLRWRETLKTFHITTTARLMREAGYAEQMIARVSELMSKRRLKEDADTQTLEDALCLVFLETQLADLRAKTPDETMRDVLRKTWQKMSARARAEALTLPLSDANRRFVEAAIASEP